MKEDDMSDELKAEFKRLRELGFRPMLAEENKETKESPQ